jgi:hypothetical protein
MFQNNPYLANSIAGDIPVWLLEQSTDSVGNTNFSVRRFYLGTWYFCDYLLVVIEGFWSI